MSLISQDFDSYQYNYVSDSGFSGTANACEINCYKNNVQVARLCFVKTGGSMFANAVHGGIPYLYFPMSQFGDVIGIFRYEKLLVISLDTDTNVGSIHGAVQKPGKKLS